MQGSSWDRFSVLSALRRGFFVRRNATDPFLLLCLTLVSSHHRCSCSHAWHALHTWIARFLTRSSSTLSGCTRETMPTTCPSTRGDWIPRAFALAPCDSLSTREVARVSSRRAIKPITRMTRSNDSRSFNTCPVILHEILIILPWERSLLHRGNAIYIFGDMHMSIDIIKIIIGDDEARQSV